MFRIVIDAMTSYTKFMLGDTGEKSTGLRNSDRTEEPEQKSKVASEANEADTGGADTILLVLPSSVELPAKGELETDELIRLIEESHFLRCLEREEARDVFGEVAVPEQKETADRIIRITLAKRIKPNLRKYMLMDVIAATRVQARLEEIGNLSPTADLPEFV